MYVPGIKFDRPVQSRRPHDVGGPGRVARAQASAAGTQARAASSVLMDQQRVAGFALQARQFTQKADRDIARSQEIRKTESEFATLDGIGELLGYAAEVTSQLYEVDRQNQYDKGVLEMSKRKARLELQLEENRYRMVPETPGDPTSPMVPRSNHDQLYRTYAEAESRAREDILSGMNNDDAKRELVAKWDKERATEEIGIAKQAQEWKKEEDVTDLNTSIAEYTKLGQFNEALTALKSGYTNRLIDPAQYQDAKAKLESSETVWAVDQAILDIYTAGPNGGAAQMATLRKSLSNSAELVELGPDGKTQYLGKLDSIQNSWQAAADRSQRLADKARTDAYKSQNTSWTTAIATAAYDMQTSPDILGSVDKARTLLAQLDSPVSGLREEDRAKLRGDIEDAISGAMVSHVGHLRNVLGDSEAAYAFMNEVIRGQEEDKGFVRGSGKKQSTVTAMRSALNTQKTTDDNLDEAAWTQEKVIGVLSGGRIMQDEFEAVTRSGKEITLSKGDLLNQTDAYVVNTLAYQDATEDTTGEPMLARDPAGYQAQLYSNAGDYSKNFATRLYQGLRSERPDAILAASEQVSRFNDEDIEGGMVLHEKLIKGMSPVEKELYSYYEVFKDKMTPEQLQASVGQYIEDRKKAGDRFEENKKALEQYVTNKGDFSAALAENLVRDGLDEDMVEDFEENNPEFIEHFKTLMEYNVARSHVPAVNFTNAYHEARMSFGLSTVKGYPEFRRDNLESKTTKEPNEWVNEDYRQAAVVGGVVDEVMAPNARQYVAPAGDGKWVVQVFGEDGDLVRDYRGDPWTYLYDENRIAGFVNANKEQARATKKQRYDNGVSALRMLAEYYPTPAPTHAEAFSHLGTGDVKQEEAWGASDLAHHARAEAFKIAPRFAYMYPDDKITRAIDPKDFDLKGSIRLARERIDAEFDKFIQDSYYNKRAEPPPSLYQMREDAKYAAEYNLKHRNYEDWLDSEAARAERRAVLREAQNDIYGS